VSGRALTNRAYWVAISIAVLGCGALVYWLAIGRPLWVDEEMLALNVRDRTLAELAGPLWLNQSAPFGWLVAERLLMLTLGTSEQAVRLLPIGFGVGMLVAATWVGRRWMTPFGAAVLVATCALGEWLVFFVLELKHYSGDTFWALLLPALAAASLDASRESPLSVRMTAAWWLAAAVGVWFGNGAVFVTPACAIALVAVSWRRAGWRGALYAAAPSVVWFASFAADYFLVLRHALSNPVLKEYWAFAFPPVGEGFAATLRWLAVLPDAFAAKPAGSQFAFLFWLAGAIGLGVSFARRQVLGVMFATVPLSALVLAFLHVVPTFERLALWVVPALYVGVALCADASMWLFDQRHRQRLAAAAGVLAGIIVLAVAGDIVWRGARALAGKDLSNYGLDDRNSIRLLLASHRAGDAIVTTHFGLVALWWYGGLNISDVEQTGHLPDGSPLFELRHVPHEADCERASASLDAAFSGRDRAAVYLGFRLNVLPENFDKLVMRDLSRRGSLVTYKEYADESRVAIFDLREPAQQQGAPTQSVEASDSAGIPPGCISVIPARRW
jgi:hypothetical protein